MKAERKEVHCRKGRDNTYVPAAETQSRVTAGSRPAVVILDGARPEGARTYLLKL
jgi:hypothetical protein